jgi:hypothetical protein
MGKATKQLPVAQRLPIRLTGELLKLMQDRVQLGTRHASVSVISTSLPS